MEPRARVGILGGGFGGLYAVFYQKRYIETDLIFESSLYLYNVRGSLCLLSPPFWYIYTVCAAAHFHPGQFGQKGGGRIEDQEKGHLERACQTARSEVLGNDAGC